MAMIEPPLALLAELTHRCPLGCPYCSNPLELTKRSGELSADQWCDVFTQAADMGVLQLHFSGGEPAARKELEVMNKHAAQAGLYTNLITSGVLLTKDRLQQMADDGLAHVQLSVQGADEAMTDLVGGYKGAYAQKAQVAEWVHEAGLALTLNCVLHRMNCHQAADMVQLAQDWGAQRVEIAHTQYYGWGLKNRTALLPTRAQLDEVTGIVQQARETLAGKLTIDYVVPDYYAMRPKACMNGWARRFINVMPDGTAVPCHAAQTIEHLEFENVTAKPLAEIWEKGDAFEAYRGTNWMAEPCKSCDRAEIDFGGCRCQALALTGDAANTDPACALSAHHQVMLDAIEEQPSDEFSYRR